MRLDNPLTEHFLINHPADAARVLENLPADYCVAFLQDLDDEQAARLFHFFMPGFAGRCLPLMSSELLNNCAQHALADVCRCLPALESAQQQVIMDRLLTRLARQVKGRLLFPIGTVGRYYSQSCPVLPVSLTSGEALAQLEQLDYDDGCQLNLVDDRRSRIPPRATAVPEKTPCGVNQQPAAGHYGSPGLAQPSTVTGGGPKRHLHG